MVKNRCLILAVDGLDGSGKTTQIKLLDESLETFGKKVSILQHSGGSEIGLLLRKVSRSNTPRSSYTDFHISMAMAYGLADTLIEQKKSFDVIIVDRSQLSMYAYNIFAGKLSRKSLGDKALIELSKLYQLDAILMLSVDERTKLRRLQERAKKEDYFENQTKSLQDALATGYKSGSELMSKKYPETKIIQIDANGSIGDVHHKIVETVKKML